MRARRLRPFRAIAATAALVRRLIIVGFIALSSPFLSAHATSGAGDAPPRMACPTGAHLREPPPGPRPIDVRVGVYVNNLVHLEQSDGTFDITGSLFAEWLDPRLAFEPGPSGQERLSGCSPSDVWNPRLKFVNAQHVGAVDEYLAISHTGVVRYYMDFESRLSAEFDLRFFPFDRQTLKIMVEPFEFAAGDLLLRPDPEVGGVNPEDYARLAEWRVRSFTQTATGSMFAPEGESYSRLLVSIEIQRLFTFYFWNVFAPILIFNFISWSAFWMNPNRWFNNQLTVCISAMLFMITFSFVIKAGLPRVPHLILVDGLIFVSYTCVFLSLLSAVLIARFCDMDRQDEALHWQRRMRWIMPLTFVTANAVVIGILFALD